MFRPSGVRPLVETASGGFTYSYYLNGDLSDDNSPGWWAQFTVESVAGQVTSAGDSLFNVFTLATYTPTGQLAHAWVSGDGSSGAMQITNTYNNRLQPVTLSAIAPLPGGASILNLTYNFNLGNGTSGSDNGNVIQIVNGKDGNRTQNFVYDPLNRIWQAYTGGPNWGETYSPTAYAPGTAFSSSHAGIDAWGNLTNRSGVTGKTNLEALSCAGGTNNQLNTCFTYDAAGNLIQNGSVTYTYDAENRLLATAGISYVYDGDGNRIEKCTELVSNGVAKPGQCASNATGTFYWLHQYGGTLNESDLGANFTAVYDLIRGRIAARIDKPSNVVHYYFHDHLGSTSVVTDASGNIQKESDYYPYGGEIVITNNDSNHYKFTGKERDTESGLDNFGARYDASSLGRFMTPDWAAKPTTVPYALFGDPQTLNLYAYVRNNPVSRADADGHCADHYKDGTCKVNVDPKTGEAGAKAGKQLEGVLNKYDKAVNAVNDKDKFNIRDSKGKVVGSMTGQEIKAVWNGTSFTVTDKSFNNGGAGGGTGGTWNGDSFSGHSELNPGRVAHPSGGRWF